MIKVKAAVLATLCSSIIGCGGGSSDSENDNSNDNAVLIGIFVDSAVEGASYSTATQSGTTNAQGQFNYMVGEQVTFSVGDAQLPAVNAAPQVSPVEMAANSSNPSATATNIARLLQSLDTNGNPDDGITISPTAAANAASINFNVSEDQFSNDTNVINLVANSGSVTTTLVSAADANAHLSETLNGPIDESSISGLWARGQAGAPGFDGYLDIGTTSLVQYNVGERDSNSIATCFEASTIAISALGNGLYDIDGQDENVNFNRVGSNLEVTTEGSETRVYPLVTNLDPTTLPMCAAGNNTQGPDDSGNVTLSTLAGFYDSTVNGDRQHYILIDSDGSAVNYDEKFDEGCFEVENWSFVSLGGDLFRLDRPTRDSEEVRIARQNGDLILNSDTDSERVIFPQVTSLSPSDIAVCS